MTTERYCANPDHIRTSGRDAPSLTFSDEDCFYRDSDEPGYECVPAVLVPVTQWDAVQRVINCGCSCHHDGRGVPCRGCPPVDTETGNGE